jgi:hypothetical protein|tara:strand:- start:415 stop:1017 length:603 start_codon:yes stop_codon:yes gene_type:complete
MLSAQDMIDTARTSGGKFACLHRYKGSTGTVATYYLRLGVTRAWALEQSILWADEMDFMTIAEATNVDPDTCRIGLAEQVASWRKSLQGLQRSDNFETVAATANGRRIFSLKTDKDGNLQPEKGLYFNAMRMASTVHVQGEPRKAPVRAKSIAKDWIRRKAPIGGFRTYNLREDNFDSLTFGSEIVTPDSIVPVVAALTV